MSDSFCVLPWIHLASHPNGGVSLCCRSNHINAASWAKHEDTNSLFILDHTNLNQIINSPTFVSVREQMLLGQKPYECEGCWKDEEAGITSKRQYENSRWEKVIPIISKTAYIQKPNYRYIELRLGNVCNTACITCNSFSSSKWYKDEQYLNKKLPWFNIRTLENYKWFENPEFYNKLLEISSDVKEIYINGGEPTLIKEHFNFLKKLIQSRKSKDIKLVYSLNLTNLPDEFLELLGYFKQVVINCSIDDLDDRNYYIRWPSNWDKILENLVNISMVETVEWEVNQTVSILNIDNLDNFRQWLLKNYNKEPVHNYVLYPNFLSVEALSENYKLELIEKYRYTLSENQFSNLLGKFETPHNQDLTNKAREFIQSLDESRGLNYKDFLPNLERVIN